METKEYLDYIANEIHRTIVATVDDEGLPVTAAIDMMDSDEKSLYFLTAKGKGFYDRYLAGININTIAICYDCQVYTDKLPADTNDKKPMLIITESRLIS